MKRTPTIQSAECPFMETPSPCTDAIARVPKARRRLPAVWKSIVFVSEWKTMCARSARPRTASPSISPPDIRTPLPGSAGVRMKSANSMTMSPMCSTDE